MVKELIILFVVAIFIRIAVGAINFLITNRKNKIEESKKIKTQTDSNFNQNTNIENNQIKITLPLINDDEEFSENVIRDKTTGTTVDYQKYVDNHQLNDPKIQQQIQQEALKVQTLGKRYLSSVTQAEKLKELVYQSGVYIDKKTGQEVTLGGTTNVTAAEVTNLKAKMLDYVENGLKQCYKDYAIDHA